MTRRFVIFELLSVGSFVSSDSLALLNQKFKEKFVTSTIARYSLRPPPPPPPNFRGDLKISDQNNWEGPDQKIKFGGERNLRGAYKHSW